MAFSGFSSEPSSPLPGPGPVRSSRSSFSRKSVWRQETTTALKKCNKYLSRLFRVDHMDFEFAAWQMVYLFVAPKKVYRNVQYRKQTKNQFARDDPAFLVLLGVWFLASATGLSLVLQLPFLAFVKFLFWVVFIDCFGVGVVVASAFWLISNRYMRKPGSTEDVEWGFAFDVHLNAFFPPLVLLHIFQLFFFNVLISQDWFIARLFGNTLWLVASLYYVYITFLGYTSMVYLHKTQRILFSIAPLFFFYLVTLLSGINICRSIMDFYHYRVY